MTIRLPCFEYIVSVEVAGSRVVADDNGVANWTRLSVARRIRTVCNGGQNEMTKKCDGCK